MSTKPQIPEEVIDDMVRKLQAIVGKAHAISEHSNATLFEQQARIVIDAADKIGALLGLQLNFRLHSEQRPPEQDA